MSKRKVKVEENQILISGYPYHCQNCGFQWEEAEEQDVCPRCPRCNSEHTQEREVEDEKTS
jgi:predicted Zn-ribbon and HTH transcriptional regulator